VPETRTNLGVVIPGFAGVYDPQKSYQFYEFVRDGNDTYISKKPCAGIPTSNSEFWYRVTDIGPVPTIQVGEVITLPPGSAASVENVGNEKNAVLRFELPGGTVGTPGQSATFSVAQTVTGAPNTPASAVETMDSTPQDRKYILTIPTGEKGSKGEDGKDGNPGTDGMNGADGDAGTITVGKVNTGAPNSAVAIENVGTTSHAVLNITIPAGMPGNDGDGTGDMVRATYDKDENGIVDDAERLGGKLPDAYLEKNGNGSAVTAAFTESMAFESLASGGTLAVLFGRVAKWIAALKNGTFATQADFAAHRDNPVPHVSAEDRSKWDDAVLGIMTGTAGGESKLIAPAYYVDIPIDLILSLRLKQPGTASPSPENSRPILGRTSVSITQRGEPDIERIHTVLMPEALYGLSSAPDIVNIRQGQITQNTRCLTLTGTETEWLWGVSGTQPQDTSLVRFLLPGLDISIQYNGVCSHFPWSVNPNPTAQKTECVGGYASDRTLYFYVFKSRLAGWSDSWTNTQKVNALKAWFAAQATAGTPVQLVYETVSPKTLTFAPAFVPALPGLNTFSVESGDTIAALNAFEYLFNADAGGGISTETDPTVPGWAKEPQKPAYTVDEITGAARDDHLHAEYLTEETDPTVPSWAKQPQKPSYAYGEISGTPSLSTVAGSGSYNDLSDKPTIPTLPTLAAVATSGSYHDLSDKPSIPTLPTLAAVATSGSYSDLSNKPSIPTTPGEVNAYPASFVQVSTTDLTPGVSPLTTGALYLVYE